MACEGTCLFVRLNFSCLLIDHEASGKYSYRDPLCLANLVPDGRRLEDGREAAYLVQDVNGRPARREVGSFILRDMFYAALESSMWLGASMPLGKESRMRIGHYCSQQDGL